GSLVLSDVEDAHDVRVVDAPRRLRFAPEPLAHDEELFGRKAVRWVEDLHGDDPVDEGILGAVDDPHRAAADRLQAHVASDLMPGRRHPRIALRFPSLNMGTRTGTPSLVTIPCRGGAHSVERCAP